MLGDSSNTQREGAAESHRYSSSHRHHDPDVFCQQSVWVRLIHHAVIQQLTCALTLPDPVDVAVHDADLVKRPTTVQSARTLTRMGRGFMFSS